MKLLYIPVLVLIIILGYSTVAAKNTQIYKDDVPTSSPTPTEQPVVDPMSDRIMRVAAKVYLYAKSGSVKDKEFLLSKGITSQTAGSEAVQILADELKQTPPDKIEARLVLLEEAVDKYEKNGTNSNNTFVAPVIQQETSNDAGLRTISDSKQRQKEECQKKQTNYNTCLSEYNLKLVEYQNCLMDTGQFERYCSKPLNLCSKPYCL